MNQSEWTSLLEEIERDDLESRVALSTWFVNTLSHRPDILEQLWTSSGGGDAVGWRWCEFRINDRPTYSSTFLVLYGPWIGRLPTAPVLVLRASCPHCRQEGFFVTCNTSKEDRESRGIPSGRCAACKKTAANDAARRWRAKRNETAKPQD
jgi:hypothetical protein